MTTAVSGIASGASHPELGSAAKPASNELDKEAFLRLLTTQLQYQDPLQPQDSQAFVAQLAQFSTLEGLANLGKKLDSLLAGQAASNQMSVTSLVGKQVRVPAEFIGLGAGVPAEFDVTLGSEASDTVATISTTSGTVVSRLQLGPRQGGTFTAAWNGLDTSGNALPPGEYVLTVTATGKDGQSVSTTTSTRAVVGGVTFNDGVPLLLVGGRQIPLSDVLEILAPPGPV